MKKSLIITLVILLNSVLSLAQEGYKEKIRAYRTAYITQEVDLSPEEAEKFWPVYNSYDKEFNRLRHEGIRKENRRIKELGGPNNLNDEEANKALNSMLSNEKEAAIVREKMYKELAKILSPSKLLTLYIAELNFNKKLLSEFRKRRSQNPR